MPFWRRKPLHQRLAERGGLVPRPPGGPRPPWDELVGIHGVPRPRDWDAVVTAQAPALAGDGLELAVLPDGTLVVDEEVDPEALAPLRDALDRAVRAPYRAQAVRRAGDVWAAAAVRIDVVELEEDPGGDELELTVSGGERTLLVDGARAFGGVPALERLLEGEGVVRAERLDGPLWEVRVSPL